MEAVGEGGRAHEQRVQPFLSSHFQVCLRPHSPPTTTILFDIQSTRVGTK
jgi:hypothetical protein